MIHFPIPKYLLNTYHITGTFLDALERKSYWMKIVISVPWKQVNVIGLFETFYMHIPVYKYNVI